MSAVRRTRRLGAWRMVWSAALLVAGVGTATAQVAGVAAHADTSRVAPPPPLFTSRDLAYATGVVALTAAVMPFDRQIAATMTGQSLQDSRTLSRAAAILNDVGGAGPLAAGVGLFVAGRLGGWDRVASLGLHGTEAVVASGAVTGLLKGTFGRLRPFASPDHDPGRYAFGRGFTNGQRASLPSGHTTAAFAAAAAFTEEASAWWPDHAVLVGVLLYGGATGVGLARLYADQHWGSDVVLGAGIGTMTGIKVVRYARARPGGVLDWGLRSTTVIPTPRGVILEWSLTTR